MESIEYCTVVVIVGVAVDGVAVNVTDAAVDVIVAAAVGFVAAVGAGAVNYMIILNSLSLWLWEQLKRIIDFVAEHKLLNMCMVRKMWMDVEII